MTTTPIIETVPTADPVSRRRVARWAGVGYLTMFALAIVANFLVMEGLVTDGDPSATVAAVGEQLGSFRLAVAAFLLIAILDIGLAWALYVVFRPVSTEVSRVAGWLRAAYGVMLGVGVAFLAAVPRAIEGGGDVAVVEAGVMSSIASFQDIWLVGLAVFGLHLVLVGWLVVRSGFAPTALGWVVMAAGLAYTIDTFAQLVVGDYGAAAGVVQAIVAVPSFIGELWLAVWLLRARRIPADV